MATTIKICVVGPCRTGKTLLCRALAEQPILQGDYTPTAAVRVQEFSRKVAVDTVKVQLWDCSGSQAYSSYWPVLGKDVDGVLMVMDPSVTEQERELEALYMNFAQPAGLTIKQCLTLGLQVVKDGSFGLGGWGGLQGKLNKLPSAFCAINPAAPQGGITEAFMHLDRLLLACLTHKKDSMERSLVEGDGGHEGGV
ncbi:hypothetical protein FOA52_008117 [Chlamydomonas sp. UWO 241]|nr:hypothetical protein FOA52_008117 [Chlamydomonas sp. UWO 241]